MSNLLSPQQRIARDAFMSPVTYATVLLTLVVDVYGTECFNWDPETLQMELNDDYQMQIPQANFDRLMVAILMQGSPDFYKSLPDFIEYCNVLSGDSYDPGTWDPADTTEIAWGMSEAMLICPPDDGDDEPFTEEILAYIGAALSSEGIMTPPDILQLALRDSDPVAKVSTEYSDDPIMFNSIYDLESSKTESINVAIRSGLQRLSEQLDALQLRSGSTKGVVQQMLQALSTKGSHSTT